jgi:hypothetical protein
MRGVITRHRPLLGLGAPRRGPFLYVTSLSASVGKIFAMRSSSSIGIRIVPAKSSYLTFPITHASLRVASLTLTPRARSRAPTWGIERSRNWRGGLMTTVGRA